MTHSFDLTASLADARNQRAEGCVKTAADLDRYRSALAKAEPDAVIEIGTFSGKSALWFARTAGVPVFTIDVHAQADDATRAAWGPARVTYYEGRSTAPDTLWAVKDWMLRAQIWRPFVVLDGDHSADTVLDELRIYGRWVPAGSYVVVEDGLVRWMPWEQVDCGGPYRGSPLDAIEQFLDETGGRWETDDEIEAMHPTTQFPRGWLRRR